MRVTLNVLITAALTGRQYNHSRFGDAVKRYARKISNASCPDFPEDLHDEIAQEAIAGLFETGAAALATKSGTAMLRRAVLNAIRTVRSSYAPPGRRTRPPKKGAPEPVAKAAAEHVSVIVSADTLAAASDPVDEHMVVDFDRLASPQAAYALRQKEDEIALDWALRRAPPNIAAALRLVCVDGETLGDAAATLSVSRFRLSRGMDAFCSAWRDAA